MNHCPECTQARKVYWHGIQAGCKGCAGRSLIRSPMGREAFLMSQAAGRLTAEYKRLLTQFDTTHESVKEWA